MNINDDEDRAADYGKRPTDSGALFRVPVLTGEQVDAAYRAAGVSSVTSWHAAIDWYARQMVRAEVPPSDALLRLAVSSIAAAIHDLTNVLRDRLPELVGVSARAAQSDDLDDDDRERIVAPFRRASLNSEQSDAARWRHLRALWDQLPPRHILGILRDGDGRCRITAADGSDAQASRNLDEAIDRRRGAK